MSREFLSNVNPESNFVLKNGTIVRNLPELASALQNSDESLFNHHVSDEKNDFAIWIDKCVGDALLKNRLAGIKDKGAFLNIINKRIDEITVSPDINLFDIPLEGEALNSFFDSPAFLGMKEAVAVEIPPDAPPEEAPQEKNKEDELPIELPPDEPPDIEDDSADK